MLRVTLRLALFFEEHGLTEQRSLAASSLEPRVQR